VPRIVSVTKSSTYQRRVAISNDADRRQDAVIQSVMRRGFALDWESILATVDASSDPVGTIEAIVAEILRGKAFRDTFDALTINGRLLAAFIQQRYEELAGVRGPRPFLFAEAPSLFTPELALKFWRELLGLEEEEEARLLHELRATDAQRAAMAARVRDAVRERAQTILTRLKPIGTEIESGDTLADFIRQAREILPDASRALLETEYRTRLTTEYGGARHEAIVARANIFPFSQFFALVDGRTTWYSCLPMGTSGPQGKGYVAASDDPLWFKWRPPNHFNCRSDLSPIGYKEAQRMGILAKDGLTKIARIGSNPSRPFGEPPRLATDPDTGKVRNVEPQEGFGA
jgi:hypothetical protein